MNFLDHKLGCAQSCDFIPQACLSLHSQLKLHKVTSAFELVWEDVHETGRQSTRNGRLGQRAWLVQREGRKIAIAVIFKMYKTLKMLAVD